MGSFQRQQLGMSWYNKDKALIPTEQGKYGYDWVDPSDPRYCETHYLEHVETVTGTQASKEEGRTYSERADLTPQYDNLLILGESGDVLEALTRVPELREKYVGKVKCVYIDPPFNTAQTFANYEDNLEHSVWLTMMRDRLEHLWKLLSDDGSIWVHLDDVENHRMRMLLDEVFGAKNFVSEIAWQRMHNPSAGTADLVPSHDVVLVYAKHRERFTPGRRAVSEVPTHYNKRDEKGRAFYYQTVRKRGSSSRRADRPSLYFPIKDHEGNDVFPIRADGSDGRWSWGPKMVEERYDELEFIKDSAGILQPVFKVYFRQDEHTMPFHNFWPSPETGNNTDAKREIQALFPGFTPFSTPKPERLLERIIHIATNPGDIVLDVFAGSGTTAAVAQKMGRRWVTCELVEDTFDRFTRPRLEKVVNGEDAGGITLTKGERVDASENGLPEGMSAEDAQKLVSLLNKATKDQPELKNDKAIKAVKALAKTTKSPDTINWRGGGGFTVARLSPTCFDYLPELGLTVLTEAATGEVLKKSVAAHLGFTLIDEPMFVGKRNREFLAVVEGVLTADKVDDLMAQVPDKHSVVFAATELAEGVAEHVRGYKNGSSAIHVPSSLFSPVVPQES